MVGLRNNSNSVPVDPGHQQPLLAPAQQASQVDSERSIQGGVVTDVPRELAEQPLKNAEKGSAESRRLPVWWLFFLPLYWFPQSMAWNIVETYLLPFQVAAIVGDGRKHLALSLMMVSSNLGSVCAPMFASWSDRCVKEGRRNRRPFIVVGEILFGVAVVVLGSANSCPGKWFAKFAVFLFGYLLYTLTASVSGPPYAAIITELIPEPQRGTYGAFWNWQGLFAVLAASAVGALIGEHLLTDWEGYLTAVVLAQVAIPLGLVGLGERPSCWAPEPVAPVKSSALVAADTVPTRCNCNAFRRLLADFGSAFRFPPFRWLFLTNTLNTCYAQLCSMYYVYWFQDEIAPHFNLFHHHLTSSTQTAVALGSTISTICSFVLVLPGGLLADRTSRATIMFVTSLLQTVCPLLNAFYPTFELVCLTYIISGVLGGIGAAAGRAIIADCVPIDAATNKPLDPGRDLSIMTYSGSLPRILLPALLGVVFSSFQSRSVAYKAFFLAATVIHLVSSILYLQVGRMQRAAGVGNVAAIRQKGRHSEANAQAPVVARACDSVCYHVGRSRDGHDEV